MTSDNFILCLFAQLAEAQIPNPLTEAARFVLDNPDIVTDTTPEDATQEYLYGCADAAGYVDPASHTP